jgi:hypothetical protein
MCLNFMAGHLLFEMMCGYELTTLSPSNSDMTNVKSEAQVEVLRYIFSGAFDDRPFPNIIEVYTGKCLVIICCILAVFQNFSIKLIDLCLGLHFFVC